MNKSRQALIDSLGKDAAIELLFSVIDSLPVGVELRDSDLKTVFSSKSAAKTSGKKGQSDEARLRALFKRTGMKATYEFNGEEGKGQVECLAQSLAIGKGQDRQRFVMECRRQSGETNDLEKELAREREQHRKLSERIRLAVDSIDSGFAIWNRDDRLVLCNDAFRGLFGFTDSLKEGVTFRDMLLEYARSGQAKRAVGREEAWVEEQIAARESDTGKEVAFRNPNGRWMLRREVVTEIGDRVGVYTDVTEMRNSGRSLELASRALANLPTGVMLKDDALRYVLINDVFCELLGRQSNEVVGKKAGDLFKPDTAALFEERERQVLETGEPIEIEETITRPDGSSMDALTVFRRIEDDAGRPLVCIVVTDVSELSERERRLESMHSEIERNRQRLQEFADTAADWFWEMDANLKFSFFSDRIFDAVGIPPDRMIGKTRRDIAGLSADTDEMREHLETLEAHKPFKDFTYKAYSDAFDEEIWIMVSGTPVFDRDGVFRGYIGSGRNVTEQKRVQGEFEAASKLIRESTAAMAQGLLIIGNNRIEHISQKAHDLLELPEDISVGTPMQAYFEFLVSRGDYGKGDEAIERANTAMDNISHSRPHRLERKSPSGRTLLVEGLPRSSGGMVVTITDISEQRQRQKELDAARKKAQHADRAKSEFLANMSHEIRTPMNGVMGMAELLARTELNAKQRMYTDVIVKSGSSLLTIINDILDFSKIDAGQMELDAAPFSLAEAVEDVATLVSSRVAEKDLELIVRIDPELPARLVGDVGRVRQIVTNLLGNAVKFTEHGHVYVNVFPTGAPSSEHHARLRFEIEDTGIGIPEDKLEAVFEKFSQVDSSASRRHEGTGLGLAIASSLVRLMGGEIGVASEVGKGSTFWFEVELPAASDSNRKTAIPRDVTNARILVVDDNEVNRSILAEQLAAWRFDNASAADGFEALAILRAAARHAMTIDCMILDYHMPGMNGGDVVRAMRDDPGIPDVPVIMLTSVDQTRDGRTFSSLNIAGHLTKPSRSSHLLETIIEVLKNPDNRLGGDANPGGEAEQAEAAAASTKIDVLVCEDNEVNQIVFRQILQSAGYSFRIANDGKAGLELWRSLEPGIVLMDVSMPQMNGYELTQAIREAERGCLHRTPVIGVTAHAIKGDREKCLDAGMDDYLSKPVSPEKLLAKIGQWLGRNTAPAAKSGANV